MRKLRTITWTVSSILSIMLIFSTLSFADGSDWQQFKQQINADFEKFVKDQVSGESGKSLVSVTYQGVGTGAIEGSVFSEDIQPLKAHVWSTTFSSWLPNESSWAAV